VGPAVRKGDGRVRGESAQGTGRVRVNLDKKEERWGGASSSKGGGKGWPSHDIVITNIVWCIAYKRSVGGGVVDCPIIVQQYCTRLGSAGGRRE